MPVLPEPSALAEQFYRTSHWWWALRTFAELAVPALFFFSGASAWLRRHVGRITGDRWLPTYLLFVAGMLGFFFLAHLPISYFGGYLREHAYGLSSQSLGKWASDQVKGFAVLYVLSAAGWLVPLVLVRRYPRGWWLATSALALPGFLLVLWVTPVVIEPLFNEFQPMTDKALERDVLALAERAGVATDRVFEVNKSVDTHRMNAYVNGLLGSHRIVLFDTLIRKAEPREVLSVVAHELGHYVLNHVLIGTLGAWIVACLGLFLLSRLLPAAWRRFGAKAGAPSMSDPAVLPLALLIVQIYTLAAEPVAFAVSRKIEHEADRFALELTRDNAASMSVTAKFVEKDLAYPRPAPWVVWLRRTHPSPGQRFDFARDYRPWESGQPGRYDAYFRPPSGG